MLGPAEPLPNSVPVVAAGSWDRKRDEAYGGCLRACMPSVKLQDTQRILKQLTAKPGVC